MSGEAAAASPAGGFPWKRVVSLVVSAGLLALVYWRVDVRRLGEALLRCDPAWLAAGLFALVPMKLLQAWRLRVLAPAGTRLPAAQSLRLILVADVMNLVLPSKMGDIAKAWFMARRGHLRGSLALSLVVFEKACDVLALLAWCTLGLLLQRARSEAMTLVTVAVGAVLAAGIALLASATVARLFFGMAARWAPAGLRPRVEALRAAWVELRACFAAEPARLARVVVLSLGLWLVHFGQVWLFILALRAWTPFPEHVALCSLAILAGLVPFTLAGLGTRDAALVTLYRPWFGPPVAAALGVLFTARYVLPALAGLPFFRRYLEEMRSAPGAAGTWTTADPRGGAGGGDAQPRP